MSDSESGVIELRVNRRADPDGARLAGAIAAVFTMEVVTRRRRAWTAAVAAISVPATLALVLPGLLTPALRRTAAAAWSMTVIALGAHLLAELRAARSVRRLRALLAHGGREPAGRGME